MMMNLSLHYQLGLDCCVTPINVPVIKVDVDSASIKLKENAGMSEQTKTEQNKRITPEDMIKTIKDIKRLLEHVVGFHKILRHFFKKVQVKQLEWSSRIGTGNAAHTGVVSVLVGPLKARL